MHSQIDLAKSTFTKYLAYSIKVNCGLGRNIPKSEAQFDLLYQFAYLFGTRGCVTTVATGGVARSVALLGY